MSKYSYVGLSVKVDFVEFNLNRELIFPKSEFILTNYIHVIFPAEIVLEENTYYT